MDRAYMDSRNMRASGYSSMIWSKVSWTFAVSLNIYYLVGITEYPGTPMLIYTDCTGTLRRTPKLHCPSSLPL
ncbi:hypothetical protein PAXRUDRAFT_825887 [Paxillus rubicundulus Ve08.2h10]|uniref:Uncharacterized protein n=1 Tax=Paxillus rubicundulus Ve08.2h10 TaxID=930991 RepID=A0A0D0DFL0_9AGAM|nr:hypothetical protein PAXRUDRAFT_825887 [Paxillus rubicundulus Ve08.2h10]